MLFYPLWDCSPFLRNSRLGQEAEKKTTMVGVLMLCKKLSQLLTVWVSYGCYNRVPESANLFSHRIIDRYLCLPILEAGSPEIQAGLRLVPLLGA